MPDSIIVYWRDIPAQVIVGKGRRAAKVQLPERFEQAIDRAAMASGAAGTDDYLAEWRKAAGPSVEGADADAAQSIAADLDATYDSDRIKALIAGKGWETLTEGGDP
ncbi:MAG: virulence factor [Rhodobacteraceae bacterium]|nr:virulence factor [Paracoccaceae bacterium]